MRTDRQTDMTKLIVAFRNTANAPKREIICIISVDEISALQKVTTYIYKHTYIYISIYVIISCKAEIPSNDANTFLSILPVYSLVMDT